MNDTSTDVLIVGGSTGGCAAAMAVTAMGFRAIITEETDWLGGQLTSQAVPPDENPWIEQNACTQRYAQFRKGVRSYYQQHYPLTGEAMRNPLLNPGGGTVSRLCHEPRVALAVIEAMLAPARTRGLLEVRLNRKPIAVERDGVELRSVTLRNTISGDEETIAARYILDATELGDVLALGHVDYVTGAEAQSDTGEPHAKEAAQPGNMQAITWCFPMAFDPARDADHVIDKPAQYDFWRNYVPEVQPPWTGKLFDPVDSHPVTLEPRNSLLMPDENDLSQRSWWMYRRIVCADHFATDPKPHEVTMVNWPRNDYFLGNIFDVDEAEAARHLEGAKQQSLSLMHWLQTECPRPDGGAGYPGLYLRPDMTGTDDGLAKYPYIRESRRIRAEFTVTEQHVGTEARGGSDSHSEVGGWKREHPRVEAEQFDDSVGIGCYRIDLHPSTGGDNYIDISSLPFQIPLGALIPVAVDNLLPACKNLGTTHITNGCYRLHPVEWNIGEAAGLLAAFSLAKRLRPRAVRAKRQTLREFQQLLTDQGIPLQWNNTRAV